MRICRGDTQSKLTWRYRGAERPRSTIVRGGVYAAGGAFFATRSESFRAAGSLSTRAQKRLPCRFRGQMFWTCLYRLCFLFGISRPKTQAKSVKGGSSVRKTVQWTVFSGSNAWKTLQRRVFSENGSADPCGTGRQAPGGVGGGSRSPAKSLFTPSRCPAPCR